MPLNKLSPTRRVLRLRPIMLLAALLSACLSPALAQEAPSKVVELTLGASTQGRPITAVRIGDGPRKIVLVGATHGFPERNTAALAGQLADHFRQHPELVPENVRMYIIPLLNPDGLELRTRFNANGVDLNRNMDTSLDSCPENDWQQRVSGAYGIQSDTGGPYSESEIESRLIRDFLLDADAAIFFHSNAGVVFPACDHQPSIALAQAYAEGASYAFLPRWDRYPITGGMHDWAGGLGIAALTPELVTGDLPEFEQNLAGILAVLRSIETISPPTPQSAGGFDVHPVIWRAWQAWGGAALLGVPIAAPLPNPDGWTQLFERTQLEYKPALSDTTGVVQITLLGSQLFGAATPPAAPLSGARFFPETGQNLADPFAQFWQFNGGLQIFGLPVSGEEPGIDLAGNPVLQQRFERAVLQRPAGSTDLSAVTLAPLGRIVWAQEDAVSNETSIRAR